MPLWSNSIKHYDAYIHGVLHREQLSLVCDTWPNFRQLLALRSFRWQSPTFHRRFCATFEWPGRPHASWTHTENCGKRGKNLKKWGSFLKKQHTCMCLRCFKKLDVYIIVYRLYIDMHRNCPQKSLTQFLGSDIKISGCCASLSNPIQIWVVTHRVWMNEKLWTTHVGPVSSQSEIT